MSCMLFWSMLASRLTPVIITVTVGHRRELGAGIFWWILSTSLQIKSDLMTLVSRLQVLRTFCASSRTCSTTCAQILHFGVRRGQTHRLCAPQFQLKYRLFLLWRLRTINSPKIRSSALLRPHQRKRLLSDHKGQSWRQSKWQSPTSPSTKNRRQSLPKSILPLNRRSRLQRSRLKINYSTSNDFLFQ